MTIQASDIKVFGSRRPFLNKITSPEVGGVVAFYRKVLLENPLLSPSIITLEYNGTPHARLQYFVMGADAGGNIICDVVNLSGGTSSTLNTYSALYSVEKQVWVDNLPAGLPFSVYMWVLADNIFQDTTEDGHIDSIVVPPLFANVTAPVIDSPVFVMAGTRLLVTLENAANNIVPTDGNDPIKGAVSGEEVVAFNTPFFADIASPAGTDGGVVYDKVFVTNTNPTAGALPDSALNQAEITLSALGDEALRFGLDLAINGELSSADHTIAPVGIALVDAGETVGVPGAQNVLDANDSIGVWMEISTPLDEIYIAGFQISASGFVGTGCGV